MASVIIQILYLRFVLSYVLSVPFHHRSSCIVVTFFHITPVEEAFVLEHHIKTEEKGYQLITWMDMNCIKLYIIYSQSLYSTKQLYSINNKHYLYSTF